jgi:hypothetical protein
VSAPSWLRLQLGLQDRVQREIIEPPVSPEQRRAEEAERQRREEEGKRLKKQAKRACRRIEGILEQILEKDGEKRFMKMCKKACRIANLPFHPTSPEANIHTIIATIAAIMYIAEWTKDRYDDAAEYYE